MRPKKSEWLTVILFCAFLAGMLVCYLFLPKKEFSEMEKRYLAEAPEASWENISSGDWGGEVETYLADHIPGRDFFVGLNAYAELITGRQAAKDVWLEGDRIIEAPVKFEEETIRKKMESSVNPFAQKLGQTVDLAIIPSAGWAMGKDEYRDEQIIDEIYALAGEAVHTVDMTGVFRGKPELFFKTDHHWNSEGAYRGYARYMSEKGREARAEDTYEKQLHGTFYGSTYSRSALWLTPGEELELWHSDTPFTVTNGETEETHQGVFYPERLEESDKYQVFLDGNHSIVCVQNPNGEGKLLVIRDSYSNSLGCFLAESYAEVVLVDLRYYRQPVSALVQQEGFDDILICYSIGNFLSDTNISWLR